MDLITRIFTALVLLGILLGFIWLLPLWHFVFFVELLMAIAMVEWGRLGKMDDTKLGIAFGLYMVITLPFLMGFIGFYPIARGLLRSYEVGILNIGMVFWLLWVPWGLYKKKRVANGWQGVILGAFIMSLAVIAIGNLVARSSMALLVALALPVIADIFAFIGGKLIGVTKFTIISPKKTKEGVVVGLIFVTAFGGYLINQVFGLNIAFAATVAFLCGIAAVCGDLFESIAKRYAQVKNSGQLLPGHGGLLDRFDSHLAALTVFTALLSWF